jgi:hypothetical protein
LHSGGSKPQSSTQISTIRCSWGDQQSSRASASDRRTCGTPVHALRWATYLAKSWTEMSLAVAVMEMAVAP